MFSEIFADSLILLLYCKKAGGFLIFELFHENHGMIEGRSMFVWKKPMI